MKITQIRNATLHVDYGGVRFLVDPMLAEAEAYPGFPASPRQELSNPLVPLPMPLAEIVQADAAIVTHRHLDHWDAPAKEALAKDMPLFAQNDADAAAFREEGFADVRVLGDATEFRGVTLTRTDGQHGSDLAMERYGDRLGQVCGVVFRHPEERVLYLAGDTVWNDHVAAALAAHRPDVAVLNAGAAELNGVGAIIMGAEDVAAVHRAAPEALLVASHMEAVNHCLLTRAALREAAEREGFADRLRVPEDGETLTL